MLFGALAQSLPDIDVVASLWSDPAADLLVHRGFTHSILFALLITPALAWCGKRWNKEANMTFQSWCIFLGTQVLLHIFLDSFNAYGTGWFEPFSSARISFNVLFVADPLFTIWLIISSLALLTHWNNKTWRIRWTRFGLLLSGLYFLIAITSKLIITRDVEMNLKEQSIDHEAYFTTPTPFNSLLWNVVAADKGGYQIGYCSVFDHDPKIAFRYFPKNDSLLSPFRKRTDVKQLIQFSKGYYTVVNHGDSLVFNDLRFGQVGGWSNPNAGFVFHYYLQDPSQNKMVVQRGRFSNWNFRTVSEFWKRMGGNN